MPATWVPWPWSSLGGLFFDRRLTLPLIFAFKSGWQRSMPVSMTATLIPVPLFSDAQAGGGFLRHPGSEAVYEGVAVE